MIISLKQALDSLSKKDRALLMYAFEHNLTQFVPLSDTEYLGVNTSTVKHLQPLMTAGVWAYGVDKTKEKSDGT